ncbi:flagellar basal body-associated protein FliL [Pseudoalteromonas piratica]|uniref:Flagellar protein FliL n=1 Tax=Pseudoalteromonas piratica TaxID=1348114 RepID=A0A0A7EE83_9GAMM|nr:flagellar basal body-associated protein FliL [Pseudoalteromonas piratica]AIY64853.1 flagellar basal body-associated protein FliL-like protein [Pseudoalteromonas piratica]
MRSLSIFLITLILSLSTPKVLAASNFGYFGFEPDIITNYIATSNKKLGYVRVTVELMIKDMGNLEVVEHHSPLLRDAIVEIISKEQEERVKSLTGREEIRKKCSDRIKELLKEETGQEVVHDVLFTKYLYY